MHPSIDGLPARWWRAARLDARVFAEVAADPGALPQAALLVAIGGIARGVGVFPDEGWIGIAGSAAIGVVVWFVGGVLAWEIAARWAGSRSAFPEVLRAVGFAAAPLIALGACAVLPRTLRSAWWIGTHLWATLALVVALRAALRISPVRALLVCVAALGTAILLLALSAAVLFDTAFLD